MYWHSHDFNIGTEWKRDGKIDSISLLWLAYEWEWYGLLCRPTKCNGIFVNGILVVAIRRCQCERAYCLSWICILHNTYASSFRFVFFFSVHVFYSSCFGFVRIVRQKSKKYYWIALLSVANGWTLNVPRWTVCVSRVNYAIKVKIKRITLKSIADSFNGNNISATNEMKANAKSFFFTRFFVFFFSLPTWFIRKLVNAGIIRKEKNFDMCKDR